MKKAKYTEPKKDTNTSADQAVKYINEWRTWRNDLQQYWKRMDRNREMYEFYKDEQNLTSSDVSLNTAFAFIESIAAKANDTTLSVNITAKGQDGMEDFEDYISGILKDSIEDHDVEMIKGTFRKKKEIYMREFGIVGNAFAEVNYLYQSNPDNPDRPIADNPYITVLPFKNVIFNPAFCADESPKYYIEKFVSYDYLKKNSEDKSGQPIYKNLPDVKKLYEDDDKLIDAEDEQFISGDKKITRKVEQVHLLECWEGAKLCVIAVGGLKGSKQNGVVIREEYDPKKIGWNGIFVSMNYKQLGRPYAYGEIDAIYKPVRAQDTIINQSIEVVNRYLRPSIFVKDPDADLDSMMEVLENGGITYGDPASIGQPAIAPPPSQAFQTVDILQQAIERAGRYSPYASGQTNQATDKTQGTASGIQAIQAAAEPNFEIKLDTIQDSFMRPLGRTYLKMIGNLMGEKDMRYTLLKGENAGWVKATKGILQGKATIDDLITVGMLKEDPQMIQEFIQEMGLDPLKKLENTVVFDIDWLVDVSLDNQSDATRLNEYQQDLTLIQFGQKELGVQFDGEKTLTWLAQKQGADKISSLYMTDEQKKQQSPSIDQQKLELEKQKLQMESQLKQQEMQTTAQASANQQSTQPQGKSPSESIQFKDLPPDGKEQMARQAGLNLTASQFIQHDINQQKINSLSKMQQPKQPVRQGSF